jgi:SAM-dependent methyltransferase
MSLAQHSDTALRFRQQEENSRAYVIPFIEEAFALKPGMQVMEIGCGEGGVLEPFLARGCRAVGIDLEPGRIALAQQYLSSFVNNGQLRLIAQDIYAVDFLGEFTHAFDLILLKDAIEHIPQQEHLMGYLKQLLKPGGVIYLGFPPWYMPHGGHQQICRNKLLSVFPYIHLLPVSLYKSLLKIAGENAATVTELLEIKETGISIERFERIIKQHNYAVVRKRFYLINPIYRFKFGWKPRVQSSLIASLPFFRNFVSTCG